MTPLFEGKNLQKSFFLNKREVRAVNQVNLSIFPKETLALVGESGSGKTTLCKLLIQLLPLDSGELLFKGQNLLSLGKKEKKKRQREIQIIFQDPLNSLNPYKTIEKSLLEPFIIHKIDTPFIEKSTLIHLLSLVGLEPSTLEKFPKELSGGQRQKVSIARALSLTPELLICDEPTSSLDAMSERDILNLLQRLQTERNLSYLFITHNLSLAQAISQKIAVMYSGELIEILPSSSLLEAAHPYTQMLSSIAFSKTEKKVWRFEINREEKKEGCPFAGKCPKMKSLCLEKKPTLTPLQDSHFVACHFP